MGKLGRSCLIENWLQEYLSGHELSSYGGEQIVGTADRVPEVIVKEVESAVRHLLTDPCIMLPSADSSEASKKATEARKFGTKVSFPKVNP